MSKDLFEIKIKEQLSNMKAPVPEGAWATIKSQIPSSGPSAVGGSSVGSFNFGIALVTGATLLTSLGVYSELKEPAQAEKNVLQTARVEESNQNDVEQQESAEIIDFEEAEKRSETVSQQQELDQTATGENSIAPENDLDNAADLEDAIGEKAINTQATNVAIAPMSRIDSNELDTKSTNQGEDDRSPVKASTNSLPIESAPKFSAEIVSSAQEGYAPFTVTFHNNGKHGESYWEINGRTTRGNIVESTFEDPGTYNAYLAVYDADGSLKAEDEIQIVVKEGSDIKLPNIFTPNGDGLNDTYRIGYAKNITEFFIQITDETGRVVYSSTDISEEWVYDQDPGINNLRYTVQYRAIGNDGKVHADQFPLIIVRD